jgi:caffeoyl-CoA O-methyltransferase
MLIAEQLERYIETLYVEEDDALAHIQAEAARNELPAISIAAYEGRLLQMLVYMTGARKIVEIGTLAGYSATWLARALPEDGKLYTVEKSSKHAAISQANFDYAGVSSKIDLMQGDAPDMLKKLSAKAPFDLVFIDADKGGYPAYYDWAVANVRQGGMITAHNAFRGGRITAPENADDNAMAAFNERVAQDTRVQSYILGVGDGLLIAVKK